MAADQLGRRLAIFPSEIIDSGTDVNHLPPLAGRFEVDQNSICFIPRFPFLAGTSYSLLVGLTSKGFGAVSTEVWTIQCPLPEDTLPTEVTAIYPSASQVPVNLLKLYVHFSGPMSEGCVARSIKVFREDNWQPLEGVFLAMEPELWDPERRRLTLLLDPGRIKRGLVPNQEEGYPLLEGVPVVVSVTTDFRDTRGCPIGTGAEQRYQVSPPVRARIDPAKWKCQIPTAGSTDPLTVEFDRPLDHALLQHCLWVNGEASAALAGHGSVGPGEQSWRFEPQSPWQEGKHQLTVAPLLEDLAGNSLSRVFDRDLERPQDAPTGEQHFVLDFNCNLAKRQPH